MFEKETIVYVIRDGEEVCCRVARAYKNKVTLRFSDDEKLRKGDVFTLKEVDGALKVRVMIMAESSMKHRTYAFKEINETQA